MEIKRAWTAEEILDKGLGCYCQSDSWSPTEEYRELAGYLAECTRIRRVLDMQSPSPGEAYNGKLNFGAGWDRAVLMLRAAMEAQGES